MPLEPPVSILYAEKTSEELQQFIDATGTVLIPVGILEEHGAHLPVNCDVVIAERVALAAAEKLKGRVEVLVLPSVWTGYTALLLQEWAGTIRVPTRVFTDVVKHVCLSLIDMGLRRILCVNGHGQHPALLETAAREIADETEVYIASADVAKLAAASFQQVRRSTPGGAIHGGEFETSLMLHLRPDLVDMAKATDVDMFRAGTELIPGDGFAGGKGYFVSTWGMQESKTGLYGDPTVASAETGEAVFGAAVGRCCQVVLELQDLMR
ncbi:MAG: hypothetical protein COZ06_31335 [Armatimonadetes bacterium CG_4_10_14_3_um_filter_66_18]|nr:MAG: hypothetical protein COS65_14100 [Armatimonadetes bacterium CG06_land_8_20_14_3_00_66_21]PIY38390.1 MAG: hypothetical protein COZ06_31335 [Armatimonadetes bacterium CG_4_10_14_3_um_filter_66_18]PIZ38845.1 MAG: hypothetical protein COY42_22865 [Armatimonadetes bacterium CG_4_10_14_0_8_um_filter_66_14]PJB64427.1 MAG: hypothetical protein CO096_19680 [Armatimonadetes bacterium CG_4_9_14_3_um_filter_66_14]